MIPTNFQTPNIIVIHFFQGGGGKFILNCLGLSQHVVLQDQHLAEQQIAGKLSADNKQTLLVDRITDTVNNWKDLDLGCAQLFGDLQFEKLNSVISTLSNSEFKFCIATHNYLRLTQILNRWPNATVIQFQNERNFIKNMRPGSIWDIPEYLDIFWKNVKGPGWPEVAPKDLTLYKQLPKFIQDEIAEIHGNEILKHYADLAEYHAIDKKLMASNPYYVWDCNWFLDEVTTITQIKELYKKLNLDDFSLELVTSVYRAWFNKLNVLK
jgi:hypothetical protein